MQPRCVLASEKVAVLRELDAYSGFDASLVESELGRKIFYAYKCPLQNRDSPRSRKYFPPPQWQGPDHRDED